MENYGKMMTYEAIRRSIWSSSRLQSLKLAASGNPSKREPMHISIVSRV
jgi:hypothetical protein